MALALIGLLAVAVVGPDESMFNGIGDEPLDETLRRAVRESRYQAVNIGKCVYLKWDKDERCFIISDTLGNEIERIKSDAKGENDELTFQRVEAIEGTDVPDTTPTLVETDRIYFDADRSATPFVAQMHYAGEDIKVRYDPFSNLRMETPE